MKRLPWLRGIAAFIWEQVIRELRHQKFLKKFPTLVAMHNGHRMKKSRWKLQLGLPLEKRERWLR